jgi:ribosomal protein L11 methyltransferase
MPYRIDIADPPPNALDLLMQLGALDIEQVCEGLAAILPDSVAEDRVAAALRLPSVNVSPAVARDDGSVWVLNPGAIRIGGVLIVPAEIAAPPNALRLTDSNVFGTGLHPTTSLCIEALAEILMFERLDSVLDVGTGSGILALTALMSGVPQAVGLDIDAHALKIAAQNSCLNHLEDRLQLVLGGPDVVDGSWPLVVANVLAAPLIEMAPVLVRRVGRRGRLILSGVQWSLESEVREAYRDLGMRHISSKTRGGWTALVAQASW